MRLKERVKVLPIVTPAPLSFSNPARCLDRKTMKHSKATKTKFKVTKDGIEYEFEAAEEGG